MKIENNNDWLHIFTCGSVDDGKSTLIGRLLYDTHQVYDDQIQDLSSNTPTKEIDFSLLLDGLEEESSQGITIDVAYRYLTTNKKRYIIADTPGHEQYTCNMATGASNADLAILLVDARKGLLRQTYRHLYIVSMMGIEHVILAINKMDMVDFSREIFENISNQFISIASELNILNSVVIPVSALRGDNIIKRSQNAPWYQGCSILEYLEQVNIVQKFQSKVFRMPVQLINRPSQNFRGLSGTITSGCLSVGDEVISVSNKVKTSVAKIITFDGEKKQAQAGEAVNIILNDELDVSRGDIICNVSNPALLSDQFCARLLWMGGETLRLGEHYWLQIGTKTISAIITKLHYKIDIETSQHQPASELVKNEIGEVDILCQHSIAFDLYSTSRYTGGFILIHKLTNNTIACGTIEKNIEHDRNVYWQKLSVNKQTRACMKFQKPIVIWFTGLSGAGKTTIANLLEQKLNAIRKHTYLLDGDNVRHGLNKDLGFSNADRVENVRRMSEAAKLMIDAGLIVLVACIGPSKEERDKARQLFEKDEFIEVYIDTPLSICEQRDSKGLYAKARLGKISNFTGVTSPYEIPDKPEIHINADINTPEDCTNEIFKYLTEKKLIKSVNF